jgi:hypothetical protein
VQQTAMLALQQQQHAAFGQGCRYVSSCTHQVYNIAMHCSSIPANLGFAAGFDPAKVLHTINLRLMGIRIHTHRQC